MVFDTEQVLVLNHPLGKHTLWTRWSDVLLTSYREKQIFIRFQLGEKESG